jgi:hypothetical protein
MPVRLLGASLAGRKSINRKNPVAPGLMQTPFMGGISVEQQTRMSQATPAKRLGQPEEVADAVLYLCSDRATYVNGAIRTSDYVSGRVSLHLKLDICWQSALMGHGTRLETHFGPWIIVIFVIRVGTDKERQFDAIETALVVNHLGTFALTQKKRSRI